MSYPLTLQALQEAIARESARMSYSNRMGRIIRGGAKLEIENFFTTKFPMPHLWDGIDELAASDQSYDAWHSVQTKALGNYLDAHKCLVNAQDNKYAVAAKFINTFMHQLMKCALFHPLWPHLHLPLDRKVFTKLGRYKRTSAAAKKIQVIKGTNAAYSISHDQYKRIQAVLWDFAHELNQRQEMEFTIESRIQLNYLWL